MWEYQSQGHVKNPVEYQRLSFLRKYRMDITQILRITLESCLGSRSRIPQIVPFSQTSAEFFCRGLEKRSCYCKSRSSSIFFVRMLLFETEFYEFSVELWLWKWKPDKRCYIWVYQNILWKLLLSLCCNILNNISFHYLKLNSVKKIVYISIIQDQNRCFDENLEKFGIIL